jgi:hypothetical protein
VWGPKQLALCFVIQIRSWNEAGSSPVVQGEIQRRKNDEVGLQLGSNAEVGSLYEALAIKSSPP